MTTLAYGVGINDTPAYVCWSSMISRCYSKTAQTQNPTYIGCTVDARWQRFSAYRRWYKKHYVEGWHVDKDIVGDGTLYSPDVCVFVPPRINSLFLDRAAARGQWPLGVSKNGSKFQAQCGNGGKSIHLGSFDTPEEAHAAYKVYKLKVCNEVADEYENHPQLDPRVVPAIRCKAQELYGDSQ